VIHDSGSVPRKVIFSPRETSPDALLSSAADNRADVMIKENLTANQP